MTIKTLFDPSKDIYRTIEKVITYGASQEARLKAEIKEYIVTESIDDQLEKLLTAMQSAMDQGGEGPDDHTPVADQPVGWLATTVTLYDALEKDIRRAFPSIHKALGKVTIRFVDSPIHQEVAKTVAVLQIIGPRHEADGRIEACHQDQPDAGFVRLPRPIDGRRHPGRRCVESLADVSGGSRQPGL